MTDGGPFADKCDHRTQGCQYRWCWHPQICPDKLSPASCDRLMKTGVCPLGKVLKG